MTDFPTPNTPGEQSSDAADAVNTEAVNDGVAPADSASAGSAGAAPAGAPAEATPAGAPAEAAAGGELHPDTVLASERLADLQRLNAEYVNYKKRVDRDRSLIQERAVQDVIEALLPVLDDIEGAREHGDLTDGPFAAIAEKLEGTLNRFGAERFGVIGEEFDPLRHEALMHLEQYELPESATTTTVVQVLQPGYRVANRVIRPARVAVADPK